MAAPLEPDFYIVELILDKKTNKNGVFYKVRWQVTSRPLSVSILLSPPLALSRSLGSLSSRLDSTLNAPLSPS